MENYQLKERINNLPTKNYEPQLDRVLKSGRDWRIGWDPNKDVYKGLVGSDSWAIELTQAELDDFCSLVIQLAQIMNKMALELMNEETITCEVESELLWLEAQGYPDAYSLRLIVQQNRCCEGNWSSSAVKELIRASQNLKVF